MHCRKRATSSQPVVIKAFEVRTEASARGRKRSGRHNDLGGWGETAALPLACS